jgi:predicted dehydrogenase
MPEKPIKFGVVGLNHGHVYGMIKGLLDTEQTECVGYFAKEPDLQAQMRKPFPNVPLVRSEDELLENPEIDLICSASINNERADLAVKAMKHGKHFYVDKPAATTLEQVDRIEKAQKETGKCWFVFFSERLGDGASKKALEMIQGGSIGKVINFIGLGPHKLRRPTRPAWMFNHDQYGGILNDIASHQIEMFTHLVKAKPSAVSSRVGNFGTHDVPDFEDFGDATFSSPCGATAYIRVDWFTPETMPTFGDIRNIIIGTKGMIELRKTVDFTVDNNRHTGRQLLFATHDQEPQRMTGEDCKSSFNLELVRDIREGVNRCVPHDLSFAACRAILEAQTRAIRISC